MTANAKVVQVSGSQPQLSTGQVGRSWQIIQGNHFQ